MAFHEVQFPVNVSQGARGGPRRKTQIVALANGDEERNASWLNSRREYDVAYGVRNADALASVVAFFEARNGMLYGFRFKDWSDYKSCSPLSAVAGTDQPLGTGDGATRIFQLAKVYSSGLNSWSRVIAKPVAGTVLITATTPQGSEQSGDWNNPTTTNWSNTGQTGAANGATLAGFLSAYEVGQTGSGLRQNLAASSVVAGTKYRVQGWFKGGSGTQARLNLRCQPGNLDAVISGPFASPAITNTAGGAVSNVVATDLGGGNWSWSMDVVIGAGFTTALVGLGNPVAAQSVIMFGASLRKAAVAVAASGWSVDPTTGLVTFATAPASGVILTAGFEFDTPVRFDTDMIDVALKFERLGSIQSIPLIEVRK